MLFMVHGIESFMNMNKCRLSEIVPYALLLICIYETTGVGTNEDAF